MTDDLRRPAAFAGVLSGAQGAGSIAGGLLCGWLLQRRGEAFTCWWGAVLSALGAVTQCLPMIGVVTAGRVLIGAGLPWTVIAAVTAVQRYTPGNLIGRVAAGANTAVFAPTALTIALGAGAISVVDHRAVLVAAAALTVVTALALRSATPARDDPAMV
ncbi:MFS transporter [Catellatospora sp. NEAU-YM18]|nr:MFS transporter [Catellatospora tritici]